MNATRIPGFTADAALYRTSGTYRTMAATPIVLAEHALTLATAKDGNLEWIDCRDFPSNIICRECGNTGPDSAVCCPDGFCAVIDKTPFTGGGNWRLHGTVGVRMAAGG
jgi:hypothetical protein